MITPYETANKKSQGEYPTVYHWTDRQPSSNSQKITLAHPADYLLSKLQRLLNRPDFAFCPGHLNGGQKFANHWPCWNMQIFHQILTR
jgi:hypothetical protein